MLKFNNKIPSALTIGGKVVDKVRMMNEIVWQRSSEPVDYFYIENLYAGANNIYLKTLTNYDKPDTGEFATTLQYSKDKNTWTTINLNYEYTVGSFQITTKTNLTLSLNEGEKVYFRNNTGYFGYKDEEIGTHWHIFTSDENIKVGGNIKSLLDYRDMNVTLKKGCFNHLFYDAHKLSDARNLILDDTVLAPHCYESLFENCYELTNSPVLPATALTKNCYSKMFKNTAITTAPSLPATTLAPYCYDNLFENCYSLTTPSELPATTMVEGCYQGMYNSCYNLTSSPTLPATVLAEYCYRYMYTGCSKLNSITTYANDISANECTHWWLDGVASTGTFNNLGSATYEVDSTSGIPTGWTEVGPEVDYFYIENTYNGDNTLTLGNERHNPPSNQYATSAEYSTDKTNWTTITLGGKVQITMQPTEKVYFRNNSGKFNYYNGNYNQRFATYFTTSQNCSAGGDLRSLLNYEDIDNVVLTPGCFFNLFYYSTKLTDVSELKLSATTLAPYCYSSTFGFCSSLTKSPTLPATTLAPYCYIYMFEDCSSLNEVTTYANDISSEGCMLGWLYGVASTGIFYNYGTATYTSGEDGIPTGWVEVKD